MDIADQLYADLIAPIEDRMMRSVSGILKDPDDAADAFQNASFSGVLKKLRGLMFQKVSPNSENTCRPLASTRWRCDAMNDRDNQSEQITGLIKEMSKADPPEMVRNRMEGMLQRFRTDLPGHPYVRGLQRVVKGRASKPVFTVKRWLPVPVIAGALAAFLIVMGGITLRRERIIPVVWTEVADRVADVDRFMFQMKIAVPKQGRGVPLKEVPAQSLEEVAMTFYFSSLHGFKWDVHTEGQLVMSYYVTPEGDSVTVLDHTEKEWMKFPSILEQHVQSPLSAEEDPDEYIRRFLANGYRELGESTIDGVKVEGIEVTDPPVGAGSHLKGVGRLWVNVRNELPVRLELKGEAEGQYMEWILDFLWGDQIDVEEFALMIPPGFSPPTPGM